MRKLPVIQAAPAEDSPALERSATRWLLLTAALTLASFLPLSALALLLSTALSRRLAGSGLGALAGALPVVAAFALSAALAGAVVGRFGLRATRATAPLGGALGGAAVLALAALQGGSYESRFVLGVAGAVLIACGAAFAAWGARFGRQRRPK